MLEQKKLPILEALAALLHAPGVLAEKLLQIGDACGAPLREQLLEPAVILHPQGYGGEVKHVLKIQAARERIGHH